VKPHLLVGRARRASGIREHAARPVRVAGERQRLGVVERKARKRQQARADVGDTTIGLRGRRGRVGGASLGRRLDLGAAADLPARVREHRLDDAPRLARALPQAQRRRQTQARVVEQRARREAARELAEGGAGLGREAERQLGLTEQEPGARRVGEVRGVAQGALVGRRSALVVPASRGRAQQAQVGGQEERGRRVRLAEWPGVARRAPPHARQRIAPRGRVGVTVDRSLECRPDEEHRPQRSDGRRGERRGLRAPSLPRVACTRAALLRPGRPRCHHHHQRQGTTPSRTADPPHGRRAEQAMCHAQQRLPAVGCSARRRGSRQTG
jgi:hypothetical protein